jgi:hypothetical protein
MSVETFSVPSGLVRVGTSFCNVSSRKADPGADQEPLHTDSAKLRRLRGSDVRATISNRS